MQASTSPTGAAGMKIYEVLRTLRERLREVETHLAESAKRLDELDGRVEDLRGLRLETRALGEAIEAVRDRLGAAEARADDSGDRVAALESANAAAREDAAGLANRLDGLVNALSDVAGRVALVEELPDRLAALESRDVASELAPRLAATESAMADALESLRTQIDEQMSQLRTETGERIRSLSAETEEQVERFSTHTAERFEHLSTYAAERFETLGLETGARVERFEAEMEARIEQAQAAVERARREWAAAVGGLDERLSDEREALVAATERLAQVEADMAGLQAAHDAVVEEMRISSEANVRGLRESLEGIRDRLAGFDEVEARLTGQAQRTLEEAQEAARMAITPSDATGIRHEIELARASLAAREADVAALRARVDELAARPPSGWRPQRVMAALLVLAGLGILAGIVVGRVTGGGDVALPEECRQLQELVIQDFKLSDKAARTYAKALADALAGQKDDAAAAAGPAAEVFSDFQANNSQLQQQIDACQGRLTEPAPGG